MKTKEVIRRLREADPSGEEEVCVDGVDIHFIEFLPAYYDGKLELLLRNEEEKNYYNIVGVKITDKGNKVKIHTLSMEDVIWDDPDIPVIYDCQGDISRYKEREERNRYEARECANKLEEERKA